MDDDTVAEVSSADSSLLSDLNGDIPSKAESVGSCSNSRKESRPVRTNVTAKKRKRMKNICREEFDWKKILSY